MTIIVYRDGIMAADTGAWNGGASNRWGHKLARADDGTLYGGCGDYAPVCGYLSWVNEGRTGEEPGAHLSERINGIDLFTVIRVREGGPVEVKTACGWEIYAAPYYAIGSAIECAFGALYAGTSAEVAVRACMEHGNGAFGDISVIRHSAPGVQHTYGQRESYFGVN